MTKIGIDMDGTITAMSPFFSLLTKSLIANGHEVHIITYRFSHLREMTIQQLKILDIAYTEIHLSPDQPGPGAAWKARVATEIGISMLFEDCLENLAVMPPHIIRVWVGQQLQDIKPSQ